MSRYLIWERSLDPQETVDYSINWSNDLGRDTISTSTWTFDANNADAALVKSTPTKTNTTTTIWLSAGTSGVSLRHTEHHHHGWGEDIRAHRQDHGAELLRDGNMMRSESSKTRTW